MLKKYFIFILFNIFAFISASAQEKRKIHITAHTHDDVGWIISFEEYYYGIHSDGVQYILDTTIEELTKNPSLKFIYVEIAFFELWWIEQTEETKTQVRKLVKAGQLEFINAGWCMNDEAATYYEDIVDQMTLGHEFVKREFDIVPNIGWQIDPFGHSNSMAKLFYDMGFDALYFTRIDFQDKEKRSKDKDLEFIWTPSTSSGQCKPLFTFTTQGHYDSPPDCDFEDRTSYVPVIDNKDKPHLYNVDIKSKNLMNFFNDKMKLYQENNEFFQLFGSDFHFRNARISFKNMNKLMKYINSHPEFNAEIFYSTPSIYLKSVIAKNLTFNFKSDDFFPYADHENSYWTGYFTSRPILKGSVRSSSRLLQALRTKSSILDFSSYNNKSLFLTPNTYFDAINKLERELAICQHHDAVSGTATQHTTNDYTNRLRNATNDLAKAFTNFLNLYFKQNIGIDTDFMYCNEIEGNCEITRTSNGEILISLYNPIEQRISPVNIIVSKPKNGNNLQIIDLSTNEKLKTTVICSNSTNSDSCSLNFIALFDFRELKSYKLVYGEKPTIASVLEVSQSHSTEVNLDISRKLIINEDLQNFQIVEIKGNQTINRKFKLTYNYYQSSAASDQSSGAYIFRPDEITKEKPLIYSNPTKARIFIGDVLTQITLYSAHLETNLKFYNEFPELNMKNGIEIETHVGEIEISDGIGKEVVITVQDDTLNNKDVFFTDANGLEFQKRIFNKRPTWDANIKQRVAGNYYPVNSAISIKSVETNIGLALLNDRAQGGSSIAQGSIELMIHRRCLHDDSRGVNENLNETDSNGNGISFRTKHFLLFTAEFDEIRKIQYLNDNPIVPAFSKISPENQNIVPQFKLPSILKIPSFTKFYFRKLKDGNYLLRLQNMLESNSVVIVIPFHFTEMILTGTIDKKSRNESRVQWPMPKVCKAPNDSGNSIELQSLEIRTFRININDSLFHVIVE